VKTEKCSGTGAVLGVLAQVCVRRQRPSANPGELGRCECAGASLRKTSETHADPGPLHRYYYFSRSPWMCIGSPSCGLMRRQSARPWAGAADGRSCALGPAAPGSHWDRSLLCSIGAITAPEAQRQRACGLTAAGAGPRDAKSTSETVA
jgi:hypothetical protein